MLVETCSDKRNWRYILAQQQRVNPLDDMVLRDGWTKLLYVFIVFLNLPSPWFGFTGAVRVANRPDSEPTGQLTVRPGQQHRPADLWEQTCAHHRRAPHSLPGARHRPLHRQQGGHPLHPGVSPSHRCVPQRDSLHCWDWWKKDQPYTTGHNQRGDLHNRRSPVRLWLQDWS